MADKKISALTAASPATDTDALPIARSGSSFQVSAGDLLKRTGDLTLNSDSDVNAVGDIVLKTGTTEQLRVTGNGFGVVFNGPANSTLARLTPTFTNATAQFNGVYLNPLARGNLGTSGQGLYGITIDAKDNTGVATKTVTNCANNGSGLIRVTCTGHGWSTGEKVVIYGVTGTTEANAAWTITVIDANTFDLQSSTFTHAYVSGGSATNRPFLLGAYISLNLLADRGGITGTNANSEDANGLSIQNVGTHKGTSAIDINKAPNIAGSAWGYAVDFECSADWALQIGGGNGNAWANGGIDFVGPGTPATYGSSGAIRLPNNTAVTGRNSTNTSDIIMFKLNSSNLLEFDVALQMAEGVDIVTGTTTGTRLPFASTSKLGFWGATPVVQQTAAGNTHTVAAGATTSVFINTTFDGSIGSTAYTIGDLVKVLKTVGILAS